MPDKILYGLIGFMATCLLGGINYFVSQQTKATDNLATTMQILIPEVTEIKINQQHEQIAREQEQKARESIAKNVGKIQSRVDIIARDQNSMKLIVRTICDNQQHYWNVHGCSE